MTKEMKMQLWQQSCNLYVLDEKDHLSDALFQVKDHTYETAMIIPLTIKDIQWQVVRNMKEELSPLKNVDIDLGN